MPRATPPLAGRVFCAALVSLCLAPVASGQIVIRERVEVRETRPEPQTSAVQVVGNSQALYRVEVRFAAAYATCDGKEPCSLGLGGTDITFSGPGAGGTPFSATVSPAPYFALGEEYTSAGGNAYGANCRVGMNDRWYRIFGPAEELGSLVTISLAEAGWHTIGEVTAGELSVSAPFAHERWSPTTFPIDEATGSDYGPRGRFTFRTTKPYHGYPFCQPGDQVGVYGDVRFTPLFGPLVLKAGQGTVPYGREVDVSGTVRDPYGPVPADADLVVQITSGAELGTLRNAVTGEEGDVLVGVDPAHFNDDQIRFVANGVLPTPYASTVKIYAEAVLAGNPEAPDVRAGEDDLRVTVHNAVVTATPAPIPVGDGAVLGLVHSPNSYSWAFDLSVADPATPVTVGAAPATAGVLIDQTTGAEGTDQLATTLGAVLAGRVAYRPSADVPETERPDDVSVSVRTSAYEISASQRFGIDWSGADAGLTVVVTPDTLRAGGEAAVEVTGDLDPESPITLTVSGPETGALMVGESGEGVPELTVPLAELVGVRFIASTVADTVTAEVVASSGDLSGTAAVTVLPPPVVVAVTPSVLGPGERGVVSVSGSAVDDLADETLIDLSVASPDGGGAPGTLARSDGGGQGATLGAVPLGVVRAGGVAYVAGGAEAAAGSIADDLGKTQAVRSGGVEPAASASVALASEAGVRVVEIGSRTGTPFTGVPAVVAAVLADDPSVSGEGTAEVTPLAVSVSVDRERLRPNEPFTAQVSVALAVLGGAPGPFSEAWPADDDPYQRVGMFVCADDARPSDDGEVPVRAVPGRQLLPNSDAASRPYKCLPLDVVADGSLRWGDFPRGDRTDTFEYAIDLPSDLFPPGAEDGVRVFGGLAGLPDDGGAWEWLSDKAGRQMAVTVPLTVALSDEPANVCMGPRVAPVFDVEQVPQCYVKSVYPDDRSVHPEDLEPYLVAGQGKTRTNWIAIQGDANPTYCVNAEADVWEARFGPLEVTSSYSACPRDVPLPPSLKFTDENDPAINDRNVIGILGRIGTLVEIYSAPPGSRDQRTLRNGVSVAGVWFESETLAHERSHEDLFVALATEGFPSYFGRNDPEVVELLLASGVRASNPDLFDRGLDAVLSELTVPSNAAGTPGQAESILGDGVAAQVVSFQEMLKDASEATGSKSPLHYRQYQSGARELHRIDGALRDRFGL